MLPEKSFQSIVVGTASVHFYLEYLINLRCIGVLVNLASFEINPPPPHTHTPLVFNRFRCYYAFEEELEIIVLICCSFVGSRI